MKKYFVTFFLIVMLLLTYTAFAQPVTTNNAPTADFGPLLNVLMPLVLAVVTAAVPAITLALLNRWHVANAADLSAKISTAANAAAGEAYNYALSHEGGLSNVAVHNDALAAGVAYVDAKLPDALKKLRITPDAVKSMVSARLGVLLAEDPTVTAGKPAAGIIPAPAPVQALPPGHPNAPPPLVPPG